MSFGFLEPDPNLVAGRYRLLSLLRQGGMGQTYRAWDTQTQRPVVLKRPKPELASSPEILGRFAREWRAMRLVEHPNVVPVLDVGDDDGLPFMVMPFLPGGSLADRRPRDAADRTLPMDVAILHMWLPAIASAIDAVHARGMIHRDIKPANIFFDGYWHAMLGDFGIVKFVDDPQTEVNDENTLTSAEIAPGTLDYMACERFSPQAVIDGAADQYSLGIIVYELCCGRRPFTGNLVQITLQVATHPVPPLDLQQPGLPSSLCRAVHRALAKRPEERFATCLQFATAALADVPRLADEPGIVRLLCPGCSTILKLPESCAGQGGKCPRCDAGLVVADDLTTFWLRTEQAGPDGPMTPGDSDPVFRPIDTDRRPRRRHRKTKSKGKDGALLGKHTPLVVIGILAAIAVALALMVAFDHEAAAVRQAKTTISSRDASRQSKQRAHSIIGRYRCLVQGTWDDAGLTAYENSKLFGFSSCATKELASRQYPSAKLQFEVAADWWALRNNPDMQIYDPVAKKKRPLNGREKSSLTAHVTKLYRHALAKAHTEADREAGRKLFDSSPELQKIVDNRHP